MTTQAGYSPIAVILSNLARQHNPADEESFTSHAAFNGAKSAPVHIEGADGADKEALEKEITALATRIQYLEAKAAGAPSTLPITPSEAPTSPFPPTTTTTQKPPGTPFRPRSGSWVNQLLARRESTNGDPVAHSLTEEQLNSLRDHVDKQAGMISDQSEYIENINRQLDGQQRATKQALVGIESSMEDIEILKRELSKNQQINSTYQKVLREIGSIVTAVADGDLSKKVMISAKERDPEIATFKRTINRMVDQLQEFSSQVTHLAKEVGTEGRLGGQAVLHGGGGIWAELTQNGRHERHVLYGTKLTSCSEHYGGKSHESGARNCSRYYRSRKRRSLAQN